MTEKLGIETGKELTDESPETVKDELKNLNEVFGTGKYTQLMLVIMGHGGN